MLHLLLGLNEYMSLLYKGFNFISYIILLMRFTLADIDNIISSDDYTFNIDKDVSDTLNGILATLNIKDTISNKKVSNSWRDPKYKKTRVKSDTLSKIDNTLHNIRRMINKITDNSYPTLYETIICEFDGYEEPDIRNIGKHFLIMMTTSSIYSHLYSKLYYEFRNKYPVASDILDDFVSEFDKTLPTFDYTDPSVSYDEYCECVKKSDKKKLVVTLLCNMTNNGLLNSSYIVSVIERLQLLLLSDERDGVHERYEEYTEIIYIIATQSQDILSFASNWESIYKNIEYISQLSAQNNITNKIIFRHMDIIDKLNE